MTSEEELKELIFGVWDRSKPPPVIWADGEAWYLWPDGKYHQGWAPPRFGWRKGRYGPIEDDEPPVR